MERALVTGGGGFIGAWCARAYLADHGIASAGFRPLVVYGPGRETGLTAGPTLACRAAARGEDYAIGFSGRSDFVFVDDVAAAFEALASSALTGAKVYNVVGELAEVARVAALVERAAPGVRIGVEGPPLPVAPRIEAGALRREHPSVPCTPLEEGIGRTVAHYRSREATA